MTQNSTTPATITAATVRAALIAAGMDPQTITPATIRAALQELAATAGQNAANATTAAAARIGTRCRLHITTHADGSKMQDIRSISSNAADNPRCQARQAHAGSICAHCFSAALTAMRKGLAKATTENGEILRERLLTPEEIPAINDNIFRFESFGDTANKTHAANFMLIAAANPGTVFSVWTKNPDHYRQALRDGIRKPANLIIILSIPALDAPYINPARIKAVNPFIDKIFAVYTSRAAARAAGFPINCGAYQCKKCLRCYTIPADRNAAPEVVAELLKSKANAESRKAGQAVRAYLQTVAGLDGKKLYAAARPYVRAGHAAAQAAATAANTDPTPDDITRAALTMAARVYTVTGHDWPTVRAACIAAGIPAATLDKARAESIATRVA